MIKTWLAAALCGNCPPWDFDDQTGLAQILSIAQSEGVVALLHERLQEPRMAAAIPVVVCEAVAAAARTKAMQSLVREHHCRLILARLERAQIPALLLKGSALAYWAYASPYLRECGDIDLLFRSRADADRAAQILAELQFELRDRVLPGDLVCFEVTCVGTSPNNAGLEVDLHWRLSSAPFFAFRFDWDELQESSMELTQLAPGARGIAAIPAYLHACMHRVQNMAAGGADTLKWLYDLVIVGQRFSASDWQDLVRLAIERGLAGASADGIRAAASRFGKVAPEAICTQLAAAAQREVMDVNQMHGWWYLQRMNLVAFPSARQRLRWLRQRLVPDLAYMRERYGETDGLWHSWVTRLRAGIKRLLA